MQSRAWTAHWCMATPNLLASICLREIISLARTDKNINKSLQQIGINGSWYRPQNFFASFRAKNYLSLDAEPVCLVLTGKPMPHLDIDLAFLYIFLISFQRLNFILKKWYQTDCTLIGYILLSKPLISFCEWPKGFSPLVFFDFISMALVEAVKRLQWIPECTWPMLIFSGAIGWKLEVQRRKKST